MLANIRTEIAVDAIIITTFLWIEVLLIIVCY
jgi:hypothetical protein